MVITSEIYCRSCRQPGYVHCFSPENSLFAIDIDRCSHTTMCGAFYAVVANVTIPKLTEVMALERSVMVHGTSSERRLHFFETLAEFLTPNLQRYLGLTEASVTTSSRLHQYLGSLSRGDQAELLQVFAAVKKMRPITEEDQRVFAESLRKNEFPRTI